MTQAAGPARPAGEREELGDERFADLARLLVRESHPPRQMRDAALAALDVASDITAVDQVLLIDVVVRYQRVSLRIAFAAR